MATGGTLTLRRAEDDKPREHAEHRHKAMMPSSDLVAECYEIAGLCMPSRSRQLVESHKVKQRNASSKVTLYDGHSLRSFRTLANGMLSGCSSRSRPWRKSALEDTDLMNYYPVRVWLAAYDKLIDGTLAASNFYEAMLSFYLEMGGFGTGSVLIENHEAASPKIVCHALTFGEYGLSLGPDLRPDSLSRTFALTARQMVARFVADRFDRHALDWSRVTRRVKEAWDSGKYETAFTVKQLIEPNPAYIPGKIGAIGMSYRSLKWEAAEEDRKAFLAIEGYRSQPFCAARWETLAGDVWGSGCGKAALPDMRALQLQAKRKGQATDMLVMPPTWGPPTIDRVGMLPGNHTTVAAVDMSVGIKAVIEMPYQALPVIRDDVFDYRQAVDRASYADTFQAITSMDGVQPRNVEELAQRHEEKMTQLGPVVDRVNNEGLQVANDRVSDVLAARGDLLNSLPPAPEELQGEELSTDFVSIMAQAQRMLGIASTERAVSFVGNMAAAFPDAADNIDADAIVQDYWERSGAEPSGLRDPKVRDAIREQRAAAQNAERMAAMMPAAKDGADAARLLSEADTGAGSLLERLVG
ncbi:phage tail protein [Sphingomonas koreensis]|uniref:Phage tail protein n=1 Tax=Sphingomonas koreensis TaxID=93064 RepID=A0A430G2C5_9SPHN|nr:portal protein [Sphingomonas koreensis]RSY83125.1 phage tail protein [Sphingomonas koreensis]